MELHNSLTVPGSWPSWLEQPLPLSNTALGYMMVLWFSSYSTTNYVPRTERRWAMFLTLNTVTSSYIELTAIFIKIIAAGLRMQRTSFFCCDGKYLVSVNWYMKLSATRQRWDFRQFEGRWVRVGHRCKWTEARCLLRSRIWGFSAAIAGLWSIWRTLARWEVGSSCWLAKFWLVLVWSDPATAKLSYVRPIGSQRR